MSRDTRNRLTSWAAMAVAVALLVTTFGIRDHWWEFIDIFFLFMSAFTRLLSVYTAKSNPAVSKKLNTICLVCLVLFIISFTVVTLVVN